MQEVAYTLNVRHSDRKFWQVAIQFLRYGAMQDVCSSALLVSFKAKIAGVSIATRNNSNKPIQN